MLRILSKQIGTLVVAMKKFSLATILIWSINDFNLIPNFKYKLNYTRSTCIKMILHFGCFCLKATVTKRESFVTDFCICARERESVCVCVCVCVWKSLSRIVCVCVCEKVSPESSFFERCGSQPTFADFHFPLGICQISDIQSGNSIGLAGGTLDGGCG